MKPHHVIYSKQFGIPQMISDVHDHVWIPIQAQRLWIHWSKTPVLPCGKYTVGRRATANSLHEKIAIPPRVITLGVKAERKIQIERLAARRCALGKSQELFLNDPL